MLQLVHKGLEIEFTRRSFSGGTSSPAIVNFARTLGFKDHGAQIPGKNKRALIKNTQFTNRTSYICHLTDTKETNHIIDYFRTEKG